MRITELRAGGFLKEEKRVRLIGCIFSGKGGHSFRSSVETQKIRAGPGNSLDIFSDIGQVWKPENSGPFGLENATCGNFPGKYLMTLHKLKNCNILK